MSTENNNNENNEKEFSFIQEQITSKKKSKGKKMISSVCWTILLASIFGVVAALAFRVSEPAISKLLGKNLDKKTVEFPTVTPEGGNKNNISPSVTPGGGNKNGIVPSITPTPTPTPIQQTSTEAEEKPANPVVINSTIEADIEDLTNIYAELRAISNDTSKSIVTVTSVINGIDWFNNEYEATKITTGLVVANNEAELLVLVSLDKILDANDIKVTFYNALSAKANLQAYDSDLNLAVIAVNLKDIPEYNQSDIKPATLGESYSLVVGTPIIALGSPNGYVGSLELGIIASKGSSVYITDNKIDLFNTDINYNENGDGVIINLRGEVIGIITQKLKDDLNQQVNTVIGISRIKKIIESLVNNTERVYFGIKGVDMTEAALKKASIANGISVTEVEANSPALEAGLQSGDIILAVNETPINSMNSFYNIVSLYKSKTVINIKIQRTTQNTSKEMSIEVTLAKKGD